MATIIHASDFCLGRQFAGIGRAGDFVRRALKESLETTVKLALDRHADLVLVTGNLFASNMVSLHLVDFVLQQVERLGRTPFVVLPGVRDCLEENSVYRFLVEENRPENFYLLDNRQAPYLSFPESEIIIYGLTCFGDGIRMTERPLPVRSDHPGIHIVAVANPESLDDAFENPAFNTTIDALTKADFDYIAVGGLNYRQWNNRAYSGGSPETQEFAATDSGQVLLVHVGEGDPVIETSPTGQTVWKELELDNARFRYNIELEEELLRHASATTLLRVHFGGEFTPDGYVDLAALESEFGDRFLSLQTEDTRRFEAGCAPLSGATGDALLIDYACLLDDAIQKATPELKPRYLQALATGSAMLSGKDVIS